MEHAQGWLVCSICYRELEKIHNLRWGQVRALERQGVIIYGQEVASAVGVVFGLGRNIVTAGFKPYRHKGRPWHRRGFYPRWIHGIEDKLHLLPEEKGR